MYKTSSGKSGQIGYNANKLTNYIHICEALKVVLVCQIIKIYFKVCKKFVQVN